MRLVQRRAGVGPSALEPPAAGIRRRARSALRARPGVGRPVRRGPRACAATWRSPPAPRPAPRTGRGGSASTPRRARRRTSTRRPTPSACVSLAVSTTRVLRATDHHAEQPAFVLQTGTVALGLRDRPFERGQVEHRLRAGQAGEVPFDGPRDDDRVELGAHGTVRRQHPHGVGRRGIHAAVARARARRHRARRTNASVDGSGDSPASATTLGETDHDVDLAPGAGRTHRLRPPVAPSTAGPARGSGTRPAPTGPRRSWRVRAPRARSRPRRPRPA